MLDYYFFLKPVLLPSLLISAREKNEKEKGLDSLFYECPLNLT
jgi:hypothetical protein